MRKFKFLTIILTFMVFLGSFVACNQGNSSSSQEPTSTHTCESVCPTCNKCTDGACTETACADKCQGHHVCESVCETCGACTDEDISNITYTAKNTNTAKKKNTCIESVVNALANPFVITQSAL